MIFWPLSSRFQQREVKKKKKTELTLFFVWQACDMCRKKKIKCDGKMPSCTHCINYKTECVFTQVEKKRNPPKGYAVFERRAIALIANHR
jgi:hypothetical protein